MQLFIYKSTEQAKVSPAISKEYLPTFQTIATAFIFLWNKNNKNMLKIIKPVEPYSYLDDWMIEHTSFCVTTKPVARYWVNWRLNTKKWDTLNKKKCWTKGSKRHLGWLVASFKEIPIVDHTFQQSQPPTKRELLPPFLQSSYKSMPPIPDPCSIPATWPPDPRIYFSPRVGVGHWWWEWQFWQVMQQGFHYTPTIHENWHISQNGFGWIFLCLICIGKYQSNWMLYWLYFWLNSTYWTFFWPAGKRKTWWKTRRIPCWNFRSTSPAITSLPAMWNGHKT